MGVFNQNVTNNGGVVNPAPDTSTGQALQSLGSLMGAFAINNRRNRGPSPTQSKELAKQDFYREMSKANQLRVKGDTVGANLTARKAYHKATSVFGQSDSDVNSTFTNFTGVDPTQELTGSPERVDQIISSETYQMNYQLAKAQNPDLPEEKLQAIALNDTRTALAIDGKIKQAELSAKNDWLDIKNTYEQKAVLLTDKMKALAASAKEDSVVSIEEAKQIINVFEASIPSKPPGVSSKDWEQYKKDYVQPLRTIVENAVGSDLKYTAQVKRSLGEILSKAVQLGKLDGSILVKFGNAQGDIGLLRQMLNKEGVTKFDKFLNMTYDEMLNWVTEFEYKTPDWLKESVDKSFDKKKFQSMSASDQLDFVTSTVIDPESTPGGNSVEIYKRIQGVQLMDSKAINPTVLDQVFNPGFFTVVNKIAKANPEIGAEIYKRTREALASQKAANLLHLNSQLKQNHFVLAPDGSLKVDYDSFSPATKKYIDKYFGGDAQKAMENIDKVALDRSQAAWYELKDLRDNRQVAAKAELERFNKIVAVENRIEKSFPEELKPKPTPESKAIANEVKDTLGSTISTSVIKSSKGKEAAIQDKDFMQALSNTSARLGVDPNDLFRVIEFETAGQFSSDTKAKNSSATGLIQFMSNTAKELGTTTEALSKMSRAEQMQYVEKYLTKKLNAAGVANPDIGDLYMAVLWPKAIGKPDDYVLFEKGSDAYDKNQSLDWNNDGKVTKSDAVNSVNARTAGLQGDVPQASFAPESSPKPRARPTSAPQVSPRPEPRPAPPEASQRLSEATTNLTTKVAEVTGKADTEVQGLIEYMTTRLGGTSELEAAIQAGDKKRVEEILQALKLMKG